MNSARPAGDAPPSAYAVRRLQSRGSAAPRILPAIEQRRNGDRLLARRVVDLRQSRIFDAVDRALEDRGYLPRADSSGRTPDQMEALTDFDPDVSTHSPTARMLTNRHNDNGAAAGSRSRELKLSPCRLFLFCPRLLGPSR